MDDTLTATNGHARVRVTRRRAAVSVVAVLLATLLTACGHGADDRADTVVSTDSKLSLPPIPSASHSDSPSPTTSSASPPPTRTPSGSTTDGGTAGGSGSSGAGGSGETDGPSRGAGGTPGGRTDPAPDGPPAVADLSAALLTTSLLPSGYVKTDLRNDPPTRSDRTDCLAMLNSLESYRSSRPGAVEARATFAMSRSGPFLQEVLRRLPGTGARKDLQQAADVLSGCTEFGIGWNDGMSGTEKVVARGSAGIGDASWHATVTVTGDTFTVQETLVIAVVDRTLIVLGEAGSPVAPARSRTLALARAAAARVS
ncbi:hypothetical protein [Streptomyces sp. SAI-149]|uniref:hypothetical protein n=1 Tax=unclassified Streptomyces TaxID=2593676 RepID=UPI002474D03C|nr:hypothetical protein [Streptomyces sp. SAI-149]MDH6493940.1 hypothetical protein [Streptomyces sp. SAI-149]